MREPSIHIKIVGSLVIGFKDWEKLVFFAWKRSMTLSMKCDASAPNPRKRIQSTMMMIIPIRLAMVDFLQIVLLALVISKKFLVSLSEFESIKFPMTSESRLTRNTTWCKDSKDTYVFLSMFVGALQNVHFKLEFFDQMRVHLCLKDRNAYTWNCTNWKP